MNHTHGKLVMGLAVLLFGAIALKRLSPEQQGPPAALPPLMAQGWVGKSLSDEDLHGKLVVADFFATWCAPCRAALPELAKLHQRFADNSNVQFMSLSNESSDALPQLEKLVSQARIDWPVGYGAGPMFDAVGVNGIPDLILFGPSGESIFRSHDVASLAAVLEREMSK